MDLLEHVESVYGDQIGHPTNLRFSENSTDKYPRIVGDLPDDRQVVVYVRFTGPDNAGVYRHWATVPNRVRDAMAARPSTMEYYLLQIGKLDTGLPWWSALFRESDLANGELEQLDRFSRANPRKIKPLAVFDFIQTSVWADEALTVPTDPDRDRWLSDLDRLETALPNLSGAAQLDIDNRMLRIRQATRRRLEESRA